MRSMLARTAAVIAFGAASFTSHGALAESVLRHVPQADLKVFDPVTNTAFITMQFAFMVYDQLFSVDENYEPHSQMVESYAISDDRKIKVCTPKWRSACSSAAFTTTGVCVTITTRLNTIVAGMKRDR